MIFLDDIAAQLMTYSLSLNGADMTDSVNVSVLRVELTATGSATADFTFLVNDADGIDEAPFQRFEFGSRIEFKLGYNSQNADVFTGNIDAQVLQFSDNGARLTIKSNGTCPVLSSTDMPLELTVGVDAESFEGTRDAPDQPGEAGPLSATVMMQGSAEYVPGGSLYLMNLPGGFDGPHRILGVLHEVSMGEWVTTLRLGDMLPGAAE